MAAIMKLTRASVLNALLATVELYEHTAGEDDEISTLGLGHYR